MSLKNVCDWVGAVAVVSCFVTVMLILLMTPFFDDWDDDEGKGE